MSVLSILFFIAVCYVFIGAIIYILSTPIQGQDYDDVSDLKLYLTSWPIEIYRMYKHSDDEEY